MKPIQFTCHAVISRPAEEIAAQILDLHRWPEFSGYGPIPGIRRAEFEVRMPDVVGTRIRITNRDGSTHIEEIVEWDPARIVRLRMGDFSPPVSRLAKSFDETWRFSDRGRETHVAREFALHPKTWTARPILWLIGRLLKKAVERHLAQIRDSRQ